MKTISEYTELNIPSYALPYLVNNDPSGLEDNEIKIIDNYMDQYYSEAKEKNGHVIFSPENDTEPGFIHFPEFGLACDCIPCTVLIVK
jgi:hypothetical protein